MNVKRCFMDFLYNDKIKVLLEKFDNFIVEYIVLIEDEVYDFYYKENNYGDWKSWKLYFGIEVFKVKVCEVGLVNLFLFDVELG